MGRISCYYLPQKRSFHGCVIVAHFIISDSIHPHYEMPVLMRSEHERRVIVLPKGLFPHVSCRIQRLTLQQYVKFQFNAQRDCYSGGCMLSGCCFQHQGHEVTEHTVHVLVHADDAHVVINLHALHNMSILQKMLPCHPSMSIPRHSIMRQPPNYMLHWIKKRHNNSATKSKATCMANKLESKWCKGRVGQPHQSTGTLLLECPTLYTLGPEWGL